MKRQMLFGLGFALVFGAVMSIWNPRPSLGFNQILGAFFMIFAAGGFVGEGTRT